MIGGGVELLAGVVQDPVFGPLVAFGPGGTFAELIGGAEFRIAPLTDVDAEELVESGKAGLLVRGFRGAPPVDAAALVDLVQRLSQLTQDVPELSELDLNPVLALPDGCIAVDARIRLRSRAGWTLTQELVGERSQPRCSSTRSSQLPPAHCSPPAQQQPRRRKTRR